MAMDPFCKTAYYYTYGLRDPTSFRRISGTNSGRNAQELGLRSFFTSPRRKASLLDLRGGGNLTPLFCRDLLKYKKMILLSLK